MRRVSLIVVSIVVLTVIMSLGGCADLLGTEDKESAGGGGGFAVVDGLALQTAPLSATLTWNDPTEIEVARIKITMSPAITGISQPVYIDPGVETYTVEWPVWPGENYEFTFVVIDTEGVEYEATTIEVQPGVPERDRPPVSLIDLVSYPINPNEGIAWGTGFDSLRGRPLPGKALVVDTDVDVESVNNALNVENRISLVESTAALESFVQETTDVSVGVSGSYGPASASVSVDVSSSRSLGKELNTSNTNLVIYQRCRGPVYTLNAPLEFEPAALTATPTAFFDDYGDRYAHSVLCGYDLYVILEIATSDETRREEIVDSVGVSAEAGAYGVTASVSVSKEDIQSLTTTIGSTETTITAKAFGYGGATFADLTVADVLNTMDDFYAAYVDRMERETSSGGLWDGGTVEVQYRNYYAHLSDFVPTFPHLDVGDTATDYRQLVLDAREVRRLQELLYGRYGEPETWETAYTSDSVEYIQGLDDQRTADRIAPEASPDEVRTITTAADFAEWTPATPTTDFDTFQFNSVQEIPGGSPPTGYSLFTPSWELSTISGDLDAQYVGHTYQASLRPNGVAEGWYIADLSESYDYYVAWEGFEVIGFTLETGELLVNGVRVTTAQGESSFSPPFGFFEGSVKLHADGKNGVVWANIYFYRKARTGGGGTIVGPITPIF